MAKKGNPTGAAGYTEHRAALLPLHFDFVPFGEGDVGSDVRAKPGRPVLVQYSDDKAEQERFLEALLELPWLSPEIRRAIMKALGRSLRKQNVAIERAHTVGLMHKVDQVIARMQATGERPPRGDIRTAAVEEVAEQVGMSSDALTKRIQRAKP
jgi:hypothetical protein